MAKPREADVLAVLAILICGTIAWLSRSALNPDGVSYLDLSNAMRHGDWAHFVQGYWSPLYPILLGLLGFFTSTEGAGLPALAHGLNFAAALLAIVVLWRWSRQVTNPYFARTSFAVFLLCSAGPPRIEAITPDLLLLGLVTWLTYELVFHRGQRWLLVGALLGLAFLAKTSAWPWLILVLALRLWGARDGAGRRSVLRSTLVAVAIMALWIVPLSSKEGAPAISSASRLNYCWYLQGCDARTPDTHSGMHRSYHDVRVSDSLHLTWASFDASSSWTYEPWSDPTAWERGVETQRMVSLPFSKVAAYWLELARLTFALWELPVLLGILAPMIWLGRRKGMWRELLSTERPLAAVMLAGLGGMGEFVAIHVEPRLLAPFALMFATAVLAWALAEPAPVASGSKSRWLGQGLASIGLVAALYFCFALIRQGVETTDQLQNAVQKMQEVDANFTRRGFTEHRIVVIGPAIPIEADAFWLGSRITAQMLPASAALFNTLPPLDRRRLMDSLFADIADVAWVTAEDGGMRIFPLLKEPPTSP